ncbi:hypothetical protein ES707_11652 [subsurface metagenome]|jgi:hypothetical protein
MDLICYAINLNLDIILTDWFNGDILLGIYYTVEQSFIVMI